VSTLDFDSWLNNQIQEIKQSDPLETIKGVEAASDQSESASVHSNDDSEAEDVDDVDDPNNEDQVRGSNYKGRKSAADAWQTAHLDPVVPTLESVYQRCNSRCTVTLTGYCAENISGLEIIKLRKAFYGLSPDDAPKDVERARRSLEFIQKARKDAENNLIFKLGDNEVCCPTFLSFLGVSSSSDIRDAPGQWTRLMKGFLAGNCSDNLISLKDIKLDVKEKFTLKRVSHI
jgi:hypothetical protein